jgi:hypothetical protein
MPSTPGAPRLARTSPQAFQSTSLRSGRREAPRAARPCRLAPVSSRPPINRTLGFPQSGWKRAPFSGRIPRRVARDRLTDQPFTSQTHTGLACHLRRHEQGDDLGGTSAPARDSPQRALRQATLRQRPRSTQRPFARARLCCPRRHRSYGLSRQSTALPATSLSVIRRVFAIRPGIGWAADLPRFEPSILPSVPTPLRRRAPRVHTSDFFPADTGLRQVVNGSALSNSTVGIEHSTHNAREALGGMT